MVIPLPLQPFHLFRHSNADCFLRSRVSQKDEPPEITYCVVNQNGMMHLQTLSPAQPMPEESELDAKFTELLVSASFNAVAVFLVPAHEENGRFDRSGRAL